MAITAVCECGRSVVLEEAARFTPCPACGRLVAGTPGDDRLTDEPPIGPDLPLTGFQVRDVTLPSAGLCSAGAVGVATFLCGPMAGVLYLSRNDAVLKRRLRGWGLFLAGLLLCAIQAIALCFLPDDPVRQITVYHLAVPSLNILVLVVLAVVLHGKAQREQADAGAAGASGRVLVGRALLGLGIYVALCYAAPYGVYWLTQDRQITVAPGKTVLHTRAVTEAEARALGQYLLADEVFRDGGEQAARLDRNGETYEVSFWFDTPLKPEDREAWREVAGRLSLHVFEGAPVRIHLLDNRNETLATVRSAP